MRVPRLYLDAELSAGAVLELPEDRAHYLRRVLRRRAGDALQVFDGRGREFTSVVRLASRERTELELAEPVSPRPESPLPITLVQGVARGERMDLVLQKATELGVTRILPVNFTRTVVRLDGDKVDKRMRHWRGVVISAAEQCGRSVVPELGGLLDFADALDVIGPPGALLDPEAEESLAGIAQGLDAATGFTLVVGPEGGFESMERQALKETGLRGARLGPRVLRTETAGLVALTVLQTMAGDLGEA